MGLRPPKVMKTQVGQVSRPAPGVHARLPIIQPLAPAGPWGSGADVDVCPTKLSDVVGFWPAEGF
jgi:hypothetical protein